MDTTTRALACSASMPGHAHALERQHAASSLALNTGREIPIERRPMDKEKGGRFPLIAGIVLGHAVTLFGPLLLGQWPVVPL